MQERLEAQRMHPRHLPETFYVGDEKVGVWWVAVATGHLNRTGAVPLGLKKKTKRKAKLIFDETPSILENYPHSSYNSSYNNTKSNFNP